MSPCKLMTGKALGQITKINILLRATNDRKLQRAKEMKGKDTQKKTANASVVHMLG